MNEKDRPVDIGELPRERRDLVSYLRTQIKLGAYPTENVIDETTEIVLPVVTEEE